MKNRLVKYIYIGLFFIIGTLFVVGLFSWDSLLGWIITKEKSDLNTFIFWAILGFAVLIFSIVLAIILNKKKK